MAFYNPLMITSIRQQPKIAPEGKSSKFALFLSTPIFFERKHIEL